MAVELDRHRTYVRTALRRTGRQPSSGFSALGGLAALGGFLAFRLALEAAIRDSGARTTGFLSYDAYYPLAYARQLAREDSWLLFHNPFGTLDSSAGLYDGMGSLLRLSGPLWQGNLFAFDIVFGALCSFAAGWLFATICARVSRQSRPFTLAVVLLVVLGGGIGFVAAEAGLAHHENLVWGSLWGLSWTTNSLVTWELGYHAVFWAGVAAIVSGRLLLSVVAALLLVALHPFTFGVFAIFAGCWWLAHELRRAPLRRELALRLVLPVGAIGLAGVVVYEKLLPGRSYDAEFMRGVYKQLAYSIPAGYIALFALPVLIVLAVVIASRSRVEDPEAQARDAGPPAALAFILAAVVLALVAVSRPLTHAVPQPAHWTRVYLVAFVAIGALAMRPMAPARRRPAAVVVGVLALLGLVDSALSVAPLRDRLVDVGAPTVVDRDTVRLLDALRDLPPRRLAYVRGCATAQEFPSIEYAISALTPHHPPYGHFAFSPDLAARRQRFVLCGRDAAAPQLPAGIWVVTDRGLGQRLRLRSITRVGRFELGVSPAG